MRCFEYKIFNSVYDDILSGKKTIEYRLLNEKSNSIKKGDTIRFINIDNEEKYIVVSVIDKYIYDSIDDLYIDNKINNNSLYDNKEDFTNAFYSIFGKDKVKNSKIVGIEFRVNEGE